MYRQRLGMEWRGWGRRGGSGARVVTRRGQSSAGACGWWSGPARSWLCLQQERPERPLRLGMDVAASAYPRPPAHRACAAQQDEAVPRGAHGGAEPHCTCRARLARARQSSCSCRRAGRCERGRGRQPEPRGAPGGVFMAIQNSVSTKHNQRSSIRRPGHKPGGSEELHEV